MAIIKFEDIKGWQKARELCILVYQLFGEIDDFGFKWQIQRASVSIMNNIAEGFERQTNKELRQFLYIAKGSCAEVQSMLHISVNLGHIDAKKQMELLNLSKEISKILTVFIQKLDSKLRTGHRAFSIKH